MHTVYMVKFRYPTNKAGSRAQNAVQTVQASSRETNVKSTIVQPGSYKRMDKRSGGSTGK